MNPREARVPAELQGRLVLWKHPHINNGCSCCYMGPILGDMLTFYYPVDESPSKKFRIHDPNHSSEGEMGPNALYREYWRKNGESKPPLVYKDGTFRPKYSKLRNLF